MQVAKTLTRIFLEYWKTSPCYPILLVVFIFIGYSCSSDESVGGTTGIQGTVMDQQGNLYPNVELTLQPGSVQKITDNDGSFTFSNLSPGNYEVIIDPPLASEVTTGTSSSVILIEGQTQDASFILRMIPTEATLVFDENDPMATVRNGQGAIPMDPNELIFRLQGGSFFPIVAPDGHQLTLQEWSTAQGTSNVTCDKTSTHYDISLTGLIPNGVYTIWNNIFASTQISGSIGTQIAGGALGRADGSDNGFTASASGTATISSIVGGGEALGFGGEQPDCALTDGGGIVLVVLYHIDGQTYGSDPGPPETWVDHLLFFY